MNNLRHIVFSLFFLILFFLVHENSNAQFGKNIVQYREFDWKLVKSAHFDIYFYEDSEYLAKFAAKMAEEALTSIEFTLNFKIDKRISFIVYNSHNEFQQTNVIPMFMSEGIGGVTEGMKNRIVVPFEGNYEKFRHVIHHELVHGVVNLLLTGGTISTSMRTGSMVRLPIWMNEGLAEFESNHIYDSPTDMFMRDLTLSESLPELNRISGYAAYRVGQAFYWYVEKKYGRERIGELINRIRTTGNLNTAFKSTFNMDVKKFSKQWKKDMKKYYWPDINKFDDPDEFSERITDAREDRTYYNSSPAISPDGSKMAFISAPGGSFGIFVKDLSDEDADPERVVSSNRTQDFEDLNMLTPGISWDPDGKRLAVSAKAGATDAVFIVDVESGDYKRMIFKLKSIHSVQWSPDGKFLTFVGADKEQSDIYLYDIAKDLLTNLTADIFSESIPAWASDSETIFFVSDRGNYVSEKKTSADFDIRNHDFSVSDVYSLDINTGEIKRLTFTPKYMKTSLAGTPDNKSLLFVSDDNGIGNVYKTALSDLKPAPLTNSLTGITQISLSNDGSKMLFSTQLNGGYDIFLMRNPFEKKFEADTLALTNFRDEQIKALTNNLNDDEYDIDSDNSPNLVYGDFDIDFERQEVVTANLDAADSERRQDTVSGKDTSLTVHDVKLKFSPDLIVANPSVSTFWGARGIAQALFSDITGDRQIYVSAYILNDLKNSTIQATYIHLPKIIDYSASIFHRAGMAYSYYANSEVEGNMLFRFRDFGAELNAMYSFDRFNRVEWGLAARNVTKESLNYSDIVEDKSNFLFIPSAKYVHDDVRWGFLAPVSGTRYNFEITGVPKFTEEGIGFFTFATDIRHYIEINDYLSVAIRGTGGISTGQNPQNFYLGGVEGWLKNMFTYSVLPLNDPVDYAFMNNIKMPLRGWDINTVSGNQFFISNIELRFPMLMAFLAGPLPVFQSMTGAVFFDAGGAWSGAFNKFTPSVENEAGNQVPADLLMSAGVGFRSWIIGFPIKFDVAWRNEYRTWSTPYYLFSFGLDF